MKQLITLIILLGSFLTNAQADKFKFNFDITAGLVNYKFDEIQNNGYSFSNIQWQDTVHSHGFSHVSYIYNGINLMTHFGFHIPIVKGKEFSAGLRPKVGLGRLIQVTPKANQYTDQYGWEVEDPRKIRSFSADITALAYVRYNLYPKLSIDDHIILLGGYRYLLSKDNYGTPIIGVEYGREMWSIGFFAHLYKIEYLREFSDGTTEIAKSLHEFGITANFFLDRKKKNKSKINDLEIIAQ
jgi:hypothetical protein